jgi:DNA repair exonuclease SbcCD ATPase subunit
VFLIMRRVLLLCLVILELGIAGMLLRLGSELPEPTQIETSFAKAKNVTGQARNEIEQIREQIKLLRRPELQELAGKLQKEVRVVTKLLHDQKVDFETVAAVRDGLGGVAAGLAGLAKTLDAAHIEQLADGLGVTADFLDKELVPAATNAGQQLDKSTAALAKNAQAAAKFLKELPLDVSSLKQVHDGLGQFAEGLDKMKDTLKIKRLKTLQEGFDGMYSALVTGAEQVERLADFTYPIIVFNGIKPQIDRKPFWPEGNQIGAGLRKAGDGVKAAQQEIGDMAKNLPELHDSIAATQKVIEGTRKTLELALKQQGAVEPLLKQLPQQAAQLAEDLPKLGQDLAMILKDTSKFQAVAKALRKAQNELQQQAANWPKLQLAVLASSKVLKATEHQLSEALKQHQQYENAVDQAVKLGDNFAAMLPLMSTGMQMQLEEQDRSLSSLGTSLDDVGQSMYAYGEVGRRLVETSRWLAWLMALLVALHAGYQLSSLRRARPA